MKQPEDDWCASEVLRGAAEMGVGLPSGAAVAMCAYLRQILERNADQNLTRITDPRSAVTLHLLDSVSALPEVNTAPEGRLLDLGTGAGFPGVPLALATGRATVLLDSSAKKVRAVAGTIETVGIAGVTTVASRAEEYAGGAAEGFAVVVARAVAPAASLVELAAPFLIYGGRVVVLKGIPSPEEVEGGDRAAERVGLRRVSERTLALPRLGDRRTLLVYERVGTPSVALPRRVGVAQKRPLT